MQQFKKLAAILSLCLFLITSLDMQQIFNVVRRLLVSTRNMGEHGNFRFTWQRLKLTIFSFTVLSEIF